MMEISQPRRALEHLYTMCQSLKSTNRVGLHIRMMHILYECIQTLDYFRFLHSKLKERPILDIDPDVDFGEWEQKEWIDTDCFALIWEDCNAYGYEPSDSDAKRIIDYIFPTDSKADRRRGTPDDLEQRKERSGLADTLRTNIDVLLAHSSITTTNIKEGIKKAIAQIKDTLRDIRLLIENENWDNEAFARLADDFLPRNTDLAANVNSQVCKYRKQMKHESEPCRDIYETQLRQAMCRLLESDFIDEEYVSDYPKRQKSLWQTHALEEMLPPDRKTVYMKRLYILVNLLGFDGEQWNPSLKGSLGRYLFSNRRRVIGMKEAFKDFYLLTTVVGTDLKAFDRANAPMCEAAKTVELEDCETGHFIPHAQNVKIAKDGHVFLALTDKTIPKDSPAVMWKLVYCLLKQDPHFGYREDFKTFVNDIVKGVLGVEVKYNSATQAARRSNCIKDDRLTNFAFTDYPALKTLSESIRNYYEKKMKEVTA